HGTIKVTGRAGKPCAFAPPAHAAKASPATSTEPTTLRGMALPSPSSADVLRRDRPDDEKSGYARSFLAAIAGLCPGAASTIAAAMTATPDTTAARPSFADTLAVYLKPRVLIVLFLGFSAGLPLALSGSTLQVWSA